MMNLFKQFTGFCVQIVVLIQEAGVLLSRDDDGHPKTMLFGGVPRTKLPSQAVKAYMRLLHNAFRLQNLGGTSEIVQSRETFRRKIYDPLVEDGHDPALTCLAVAGLKEKGDLLKFGKAKSVTTAVALAALSRDEGQVQEILHTKQTLVFSVPEVDHMRELVEERLEEMEELFPEPVRQFADLVEEADDLSSDEKTARTKELISAATGYGDIKKRMEAITDYGVYSVLRGRMSTSGLFPQIDGALSVPDWFSTHKQQVVTEKSLTGDDLKAVDPDSDSGASHLRPDFRTSPLLLGHVILNVPLFTSNTEAVQQADWRSSDGELASQVVGNLVRLIATLNPGAKRGSTAPNPLCQMIMVEVGPVARVLSPAVLEPVDFYPSVFRNTVDRLQDYITKDLAGMYGDPFDRAVSGLRYAQGFAEATGAGDLLTVDKLADWTTRRVKEEFNNG